mgnify:FL=1
MQITENNKLINQTFPTEQSPAMPKLDKLGQNSFNSRQSFGIDEKDADTVNIVLLPGK